MCLSRRCYEIELLYLLHVCLFHIHFDWFIAMFVYGRSASHLMAILSLKGMCNFWRSRLYYTELNKVLVSNSLPWFLVTYTLTFMKAWISTISSRINGFSRTQYIYHLFSSIILLSSSKQNHESNKYFTCLR